MRAASIPVLLALAISVGVAQAQPAGPVLVDQTLINDVQAPLLPQVDGDGPDDAFAREVWFMTQAGGLSSKEVVALEHEARKMQVRWGLRIGDSASAEPLRRELSLLLKDISRSAWEKVRTEREWLKARQRHAALVVRVAELDELLVLLTEHRTQLCDALVMPALRVVWQSDDATPPFWTVKRLPAAVSVGELGSVEIPEQRLAAILWPGQFAAYKQLSASANQQPVMVKRLNDFVVFARQWPLDEQQRRLKIHLDRLIDTADTVCRLSPAQREKLSLAGRIDIDRLSERYRAESLESEELIERGAALSALMDQAHRIFSEPASHYRKALAARLTAEQAQRLAAADGQRHAFRRQAIIEAVVVGVERSASLTSAQCEKLTQTLTDLSTVPMSVQYSPGACLRIIAEVPEEKLRPIFSDEQRPAIRRYLRQLDQITRQLEAEAAGKVAVLRDVKGEAPNGQGNVEIEFEAKELRLDVE